MKFLIHVALIFTTLLALGLCGTISNVIHTTAADGAHGGLWKKKWSWKPKWVRSWNPKTIYVPKWARVWTPIQISEFVPSLSLPPPASPHNIAKATSVHY